MIINFILKLNSLIFFFLNKVIKIYYVLHFKNYFLYKKSLKKTVKNRKDDRIYIILNAPSLKKQEIQNLKGNELMFVNRGFKHEHYKYLQPKFHVFVDNKIISGVWSLDWFDEIVEQVPDIIFILPLTWHKKKVLKPVLEKGYKILWLNEYELFNFLGVSGACFKVAIKIGYKKIYFTGFDANGIAYELINSNSHFYGNNEENSIKTSEDFSKDLFMHSRHLIDLNRLARKNKKGNIEIINLTEGGLLDMFPRENIESHFNTI